MIISTSLQPHSIPTYVVVETPAAGEFLATVLGWPNVQTRGSSRQEVLAKLQDLVTERLAQVELIPLALPIPDSPQHHPWLEFAGVYQHEEQFDAVMAEVEAYRKAQEGEAESV
jgi:predicted RNase H-like HicB family nuclease